MSLKIKLTSIMVDDQSKALRFYTDILGFVKKADFSQGSFRWLTVASADAETRHGTLTLDRSSTGLEAAFEAQAGAFWRDEASPLPAGVDATSTKATDILGHGADVSASAPSRGAVPGADAEHGAPPRPRGRRHRQPLELPPLARDHRRDPDDTHQHGLDSEHLSLLYAGLCGHHLRIRARPAGRRETGVTGDDQEGYG